MEEYRELIAEANKRAVQAGGAIDQGEIVAPPNKPNPTPVSVKPGTKVSKYVRIIDKYKKTCSSTASLFIFF